MTEILLIILILLTLVTIFLLLKKSNQKDYSKDFEAIKEKFLKTETTLEMLDKSVKDEFSRNRNEANENYKIIREELSKSLNNFSENFDKNVSQLNDLLTKNYKESLELQKLFLNEIKETNLQSNKNLKETLKEFENSFKENIKNLNELLVQKFEDFSTRQSDLNNSLTENIKILRESTEKQVVNIREENTNQMNNLRKSLETKFNEFAEQQSKLNDLLRDNIKDVRETVEKQLKAIREDNTKQLEEMRQTVDEKLQKTLSERLKQSFETVGKQLQAVQQGLGEMKNLANDVGGLKKVLSNVKMRGGIGEVQLEMILEQILAPAQYEANVKTKRSSNDLVEFAIKLPGKDDEKSTVWLPIDAKFPSEKYEHLQDAYESGDPDQITEARKQLEQTIKKMAKDIGDKYLDPPYTTDFGIMFLPFEGIYAEVVRKTSLLETLQRDYRVIVTGPSTLAAILNSLQMGFRTLAIQKRSSEVWKILAAVKTEFQKFGVMLEKARKNVQTGLNQLDDVIGTRTRAIQRKLKDVETLSLDETSKIFPNQIENNDQEKE